MNMNEKELHMKAINTAVHIVTQETKCACKRERERGKYVFPRKMAEDASAMLAYNCKQIRAVTEVCTLI